MGVNVRKKFKEFDREDIINLLYSTNRKGVSELIEYLESEGFFDAPASHKYHGNYAGGLAHHSMCLHRLMREMINKFDIDVDDADIIIPCLLHDVCKLGLYEIKDGKISKKTVTDSRHALLSLERIKGYIELTPLEEDMIRYHMGMYGTVEFSERGEYSLKELAEKFNENKLLKLFYMCDDMSAQWIESDEDDW